jgi:hypothetical protein
MVLKHIIAFVCTVTALAPSSALAESWLCIADQATGFSFNSVSKKWADARFDVADRRYLIVSEDDEKYPYMVKRFGKPDSLPMLCDAFAAETFLHCRGLAGNFRFNQKTLRYIHTYDVGYINPTPGLNDMTEGEDTPFMEIGRCSKID